MLKNNMITTNNNNTKDLIKDNSTMNTFLNKLHQHHQFYNSNSLPTTSSNSSYSNQINRKSQYLCKSNGIDDDLGEDDDDDANSSRSDLEYDASYNNKNINKNSHIKHQLNSSEFNSNSSSKFPSNNFILSEICSKNNNNNNNNNNHNNNDVSPNSNFNNNPNIANMCKSDLICVICGASANGYNFDAITCESCKAFFRRNAFRPLNLFRCTNNNACEINIFTRKKCKKCRIMKCFKLGMRRDWIMSEREREEKRKKIEENRRKKADVYPNGSSDPMNPGSNNGNSMSGDDMNGYYMDDEASQSVSTFSSGAKPIRRRRRRRKFSGGNINPLLQTPSNNINIINSNLDTKLSPMELFHKMGLSLNNNNSLENSNSKIPVNNNEYYSNAFYNNHRNHQIQQVSSSSSFPSAADSFQFNSLIAAQQANKNHHHHSNNNNINNNNINNNINNNNNNNIININNNNNNNPTTLSLKNFYDNSNNNVLQNNTNTQQQLVAAKYLSKTFSSNNNNEEIFHNYQHYNSVTSSPPNAATSASMSSYLSILDKLTSPNSSSSNANTHNLSSQSTLKLFESLTKSITNNNNNKSEEISNSTNNNNSNSNESDEISDCDTPNNNINNYNDNDNDNSNFYEQSKIHKFLNRQNKKRRQTNNNNIDIDNKYENNNNNISPIDYSKNNKENTDNEKEKPEDDAQENNCQSLFSNYLLKTEASNLFKMKMPFLSHEMISNTISMSDLQRKQVAAIAEAYRRAIQLVKAQGSPNNLEDINTTINLTELGVRRIIFYFKLISDFRSLDHDLMVKLLKQNMMSLLQIHGVNSYNKEENTFKEPNTDDTPFSAASLVPVYGDEIYNFSISITRNLFDLCNNDMTYIKILMLIVIFDPTNENLTQEEKKLVSSLQNKYVTLIYAYMREMLGSPKSELTFKGIIYEINKVNILANWFERTVVEKSNYEYVRPLMKEIFSFPAGNTPIVSTNNSPASVRNHNSASKSTVNSPQYDNLNVRSNSNYNHNNNATDFNDKTPSTASSFVSDTPHSNMSSYM